MRTRGTPGGTNRWSASVVNTAPTFASARTSSSTGECGSSNRALRPSDAARAVNNRGPGGSRIAARLPDRLRTRGAEPRSAPTPAATSCRTGHPSTTPLPAARAKGTRESGSLTCARGRKDWRGEASCVGRARGEAEGSREGRASATDSPPPPREVVTFITVAKSLVGNEFLLTLHASMIRST